MRHTIFGSFLGFTTLLLATASIGQTAETSDAQIASRIDSYLSQNVERGFSGAVLVAEGGQVILSKGYGLANKEENISNTAQTVFDIGSLTKQFTGAAILKLVEQEKLNVQDPLSRFFENVPADKEDITIHQLLTHTAGMPQYSGEDYDYIPTDEYIRHVLHSELVAAPGERFAYSNVGYSILGLIIEKVSGDEYEAFIYNHLLQPAGMSNTGYFRPDWNSQVIAQGYNYEEQNHWGSNLERWVEDGGVSWHLKANGGVLSTVEDMYKWRLALEAHQILPPALKEIYEAPHVDAGRGQHYGYGWRSGPAPDGSKIVYHNGANGIFFATVRHFVDKGRVVIFMTNEGRAEVYRMSRHIETMLDDPGFAPPLLLAPAR